MSKLDNIKPGDVFEFYDKFRFESDSEDSSYGSDDDLQYEPYIPREQETIYLGRETENGVEIGHFLTVNNNPIRPSTFYYKQPMSRFLATIEMGYTRNNTGSKIPKPLLEEIRFNVPIQKENLNALEEKVSVELPPDVKNKVLSYFKMGPNIKQNYEGGRIRKSRKSRKTKLSRNSKKINKMKKSRNLRRSKKSRKASKY
jgi:hypothetical protein